jgi:hypothetical protein
MDQVILRAIWQGADKLDSISYNSGSIFLPDLETRLQRLVKNRKLTRYGAEYHLNVRQQADKEDSSYRQRYVSLDLPGPHPGDMDWRFETATCAAVSNHLIHNAYPHNRILLIGAPSIFAFLHDAQRPISVQLLDGNTALIDYLKRQQIRKSFEPIRLDLLRSPSWSSGLRFDVCLCDPPWYPEHYMGCLVQAATVLNLGSITYVSMLPIGVRPSAANDRSVTIARAAALGLHVLSIESNALKYETPIFELNSLKQGGITPTRNWRTGDLAIFVKVTEPTVDAIESIEAEIRSFGSLEVEWDDFIFGREKVKLRGPFDDWAEEPEVIHIEPNDILPTVSRRYEGRSRIDLWVHDNRVFGLRCHAAFQAALRRVRKADTSPGLNSKIENAMSLIRSVIPGLL